MLVIVGAGGHGRDLQAIADRVSLPSSIVDDDGWFRSPVPLTPCMYTLGVNDPKVRAKLDKRFGSWSAKELIDPSAHIGPEVLIGPGAVVGPNAVLLREVTIGRHTHLNYGVTATRCSIGDYSTVGPGVTICGDVTIGKGCFVGAGAVIKNLTTIGDGAVVAAGAVVVDDVPAGALVKGVPAR